MHDERIGSAGVPVHVPKYLPNFSQVSKVVSIRVRADLVILADRGGQRFHPKITEHVLPIWFDHSAPHDPRGVEEVRRAVDAVTPMGWNRISILPERFVWPSSTPVAPNGNRRSILVDALGDGRETVRSVAGILLARAGSKQDRFWRARWRNAVI